MYIYLFVSLFIYVVLSLFIAIIMDAYEVVKVIMNRANEHENENKKLEKTTEERAIDHANGMLFEC